jgi:hypothetical protein
LSRGARSPFPDRSGPGVRTARWIRPRDSRDRSAPSRSPYFDLKSYIPASSSEIDDVIASMILGVPRFIDRTLVFPDRNIDNEFETLTQDVG